MKNVVRSLLSLALLALLLGGPANAALVVEEQFIYEPPEANIDGQNGGTGFDGPWVSTISHGRIYWMAEGLSFTDISASELPVAGNALSRLGSMGRAEGHRTISAASQAALLGDDTTMWFSQLHAAPAEYRNSVFVFGTQPFAHTPGYQFANPGYGFGLTNASYDIGTGAGGNGTGPISAVAFNNTTGASAFVEGTYTPSPTTATSLIVGKINWKPNGTPDELFLFNVTDMSTEPAEGTAIASITDQDFDQSAFNMIAMYDGNNTITDEIRFGNTFADVLGGIIVITATYTWDEVAKPTGNWADANWVADTGPFPPDPVAPIDEGDNHIKAVIQNGAVVTAAVDQSAAALDLLASQLDITSGATLTVSGRIDAGDGTINLGAGAGLGVGYGSAASVSLAGDATVAVTAATLEVASLTGAGGTLTKQGAGTLELQAADLPAAAATLVLSGGTTSVLGSEGLIDDILQGLFYDVATGQPDTIEPIDSGNGVLTMEPISTRTLTGPLSFGDNTLQSYAGVPENDYVGAWRGYITVGGASPLAAGESR